MATQPDPVSVISPRFCVPRPVDLAVTEKVWQIIGRGDFVINDVDGNLIFKVQKSVLLDASGLPIVTLREKTFSARSRWQVFKGESREDKDMIFSVRRSSMFQMRTKLHVFLANNISEDVCDYSVHASWFGGSCEVYVGDSPTIIAQVQRNSSIRTHFTGKNRYRVTVNPNVDYAFITALIIILDEIVSQGHRTSHDTHTGAGHATAHD